MVVKAEKVTSGLLCSRVILHDTAGRYVIMCCVLYVRVCVWRQTHMERVREECERGHSGNSVDTPAILPSGSHHPFSRILASAEG